MSAEVEKREIAGEQEFVDRVYRQLEQAGKHAEALAREGHDRGRLGHEGGLVERDAMVFQAARRLAVLDAASEGLVFGRLDLRDDRTDGPRYIGRIGLRDENRDSLLVDWRAPAAAVFYQATAADPRGVVRRRVLRCSGSRVVAIEDDLLDADSGTDLAVVGEGALMAQLSRARDASMHSIVATIQAEQDRAIRAPGRGAVLISGGPGTGKTVVALHRAAYLLYSDRRRYQTGGVLVVGPSPIFLRYIERVLPSLGETAVRLRSVGEVVDGVSATRRDDPAVGEVKGSARMAELLRRAARQPVPGAPDEFRFFYRDDNLVVVPKDLTRLRRQLLAHGKRNRQVGRVTAALTDALWRQVRGPRARERGREDFADALHGSAGFLGFVHAWWPPLVAAQVLGWLRDPEFLARIAPGVLSGGDAALLAEHWCGAEPGNWSVDDVPLLDELRYQLGDPPGGDPEHDPLAHLMGAGISELDTVAEREYGPRAFDQPSAPTRIEDDVFAHVLVDEAQDLTPMQWRMLGRRGRTATWTVVGDPAQSSWPDTAEAARAREEALGDKPRHGFHLSTNYRNSKEIYQYAAAYARRAGLDADQPDAVRSTGVAPQHRRVEDLEQGVRESVAEVADDVDGSVGVVVPVARRSQVRGWLAAAGQVAAEAAGAADARIVVLDGVESKGLEFDGVVVVEPGEIEGESGTGRATLYVALTRATQRMVTVSAANTAPSACAGSVSTQ